MSRTKSKYVLLSLIVILGAFLRIYGLDRSLWLDEVISVNRQKDLQALVSGASHQPLFYIILHFFMLIGNDELIVRLPSVIFGVLSILLIYKVGEQFFGRPKEGLISAFLLSTSTMHIRYSQEARYYPLVVFLSLSSLFLFYKAIKGNSKKLWVGFTLLTILCIITHYYMLFIPFIEILFFTFILIKNRESFIMSARRIGKKRILLLILGFMIISIFLLPLLQRALYVIQTGIAWVSWGLEPASFFEDLFSFFSFGFSFSIFSYLYGSVIASFLYVFLLFFLLGLVTSIREHRDQTVLLLFWVFLPAVIIFIITFSLSSPVTDAKYLIFILPGYLIGISRGISTIANILLKYYYKIRYGLSSIPLLEKRQLVISLSITMVILVAFTGVSVVTLPEHYKSPRDYEDWRAAAEYLQITSRSGDVIIVEPIYLEQCLLYYYEKNSNTVDFMKNITTTTGGSLRPFKDFKDLVLTHDQVWLVLSPRHNWQANTGILNWTMHNSIEVRSFTGVSIYSHAAGLILVSIKNMSFIGLDSPPGEPVAEFWHNDDSATFDINVSKATNYTIAIHAKSILKSALELVIDDATIGVKTFIENDWSYIELDTFYLDSGLHEIKIINREGGDLGDTNVFFDQVAICPKH